MRTNIPVYHKKQIIIRYSPIQMYKELWDDCNAHPGKYIKNHKFLNGEVAEKIMAYWCDEQIIYSDLPKLWWTISTTCPLCRAAGRSVVSGSSGRSDSSVSSCRGLGSGGDSVVCLSGPNSPPY